MITRGQKINDRYEIIRNIGEGGMANVYLAHDLILDRDVAVKILRGDLAGDEKFVRRFQREAIAASSLSHPNIVEMYDVGEDNGKYFIVMEYIQGNTLKNLIKRRGALTVSETIDIMLQLTSGLACAHDSYIIHRDIKPQNILILDDGRIKITDFGIAMALNNKELTQTNSVMGSVHYLPPEQANGSGATIQSDIYSAGILMYELLVGKLPFKGDNAVEIALKQMKEQIPSVRDYNPDIPQSIENVILKATAKNPKNRYQTAKEMHDDIKTALERKDEERIMFDYPEKEELSKVGSRAKRNEANNIEADDDKKTNRELKIVGAVLGGLLVILLIIFLVVPNLSGNKVEIPDVYNMSEKGAIDKLEDKGLKVTTKKAYDEKVKKGKVIKTNPKEGTTVKKKSKITLYISKGSKAIKVEDYTGKDYKDIKKKLEKVGIEVNLVEEEKSEDDNAKEGEIIKQDVEEGKKLKKGDKISLTIVKLVTVYPNFVDEGYTLDKVKEFCEKNEITLDSTEKETKDAKEGTIVYQSRQAGSKVVKGVTLRVTVAKKPVEIEVSSIRLDRSDEVLHKGDVIHITATISPDNATNKTLTWDTSNTGVATVKNGTVTAQGPGTAIITVTSSNGKSNSIKVTVE